MWTVVSSGVSSGRGMKETSESEGGLRRAQASQPPHLHSSAHAHVHAHDKVGVVLASTGTPASSNNGVGHSHSGAGSDSAPNDLSALHSAASHSALFGTPAQQAAMAAAGLFRMGSLAPLPLPALMASLQAAAGVGVGVGVMPLGRSAGAGLPNLLGAGSAAYAAANLFSPGHVMSAQQSAQLLHSWSKLLAAPAERGGDHGAPQVLLNHHLAAAKERAASYSAGLTLLHGTAAENALKGGVGVGSSSGGSVTVSRRSNAARLEMERRQKEEKSLVGEEVIGGGVEEGTSSPPSVNGSSGGTSSAGSGRKSRSNASSAAGKSASNNSNSSRENGDASLQQLSRDKVFSCSICQRTFGYKHVLQNHERTHTGEKPFECKQCGKRFTRDHHLKTHMRLHTGEKPYNCTHCDRQFVQVANLRRHLRVHTGERPYACELCTSRFSDSNQLKAHMLIHKGEKPFECPRCSGRFRRRHHLMHHKCPAVPGHAATATAPAADDIGALKPKRARVSKTIIIHATPTPTPATPTPPADSESEPPPTPSSYGHNDDLLDDSDALQRATGLLHARLTHCRPQPPSPGLIPPFGPSSAAVKIQAQGRQRKARETRRVIRQHPASSPPPTQPQAPEQTEPEDLSMTSTVCNIAPFTAP